MGVAVKKLAVLSFLLTILASGLLIAGDFTPEWRVSDTHDFKEGLMQTSYNGESQYNTLWTSNYTNPAWSSDKEGFPDFFLVTQICEALAVIFIPVALIMSFISICNSTIGLDIALASILSLIVGSSMMGVFTYLAEYVNEPWVSVGEFGYSFILAACGCGMMLCDLLLTLHSLRRRMRQEVTMDLELDAYY